jgi:hypothetical protein
MSAGHPRSVLRRIGVSRSAALEHAWRLAIGREPQKFGALATPFEAGARPVNLEAQIVEVADRDLARRENAARAAVEAHQDMGVVVEPAPGHEGRQIRRYCVDFEAGHKERKVMGMDADIGEAGRGARALRIGSPLRLLMAAGVDWLRQPVLDIGGMNDPYVADLARSDHLARLPNRRVAGIVEGDGEDEPRGARELNEFLRLGHRG